MNHEPTHDESPQDESPRGIRELAEMKRAGRRISMLTAYDASFARLMDAAGVDCVLVGDSLGNVIQGRDTTLPVRIGDMVYHTRAVRRGVRRALLIADMPFLAYHDRPTALRAAGRLMRAGAGMVKVEGAGAVVERVAELTAQGIPVCGHLGLTPQHVHRLGGYRVQGRERDAAAALLEQARELESAGATLLVAECIPAGLGAELARALTIPVIGIGAGAETDGQVLVVYDALGISPGPRPRFVRDFLSAAGTIPGALSAYVEAVRDGTFPSVEESYR